MKYCNKCGSEIPDWMPTCPKCAGNEGKQNAGMESWEEGCLKAGIVIILIFIGIAFLLSKMGPSGDSDGGSSSNSSNTVATATPTPTVATPHYILNEDGSDLDWSVVEKNILEEFNTISPYKKPASIKFNGVDGVAIVMNYKDNNFIISWSKKWCKSWAEIFAARIILWDKNKTYDEESVKKICGIIDDAFEQSNNSRDTVEKRIEGYTVEFTVLHNDGMGILINIK